jgi:hypothetical protein
LNVTDSPGDEGAIFAAVVQGKTLEPQELLKLKAKDDSGTAIIGGINFPIEQSRIKKQRDFNGDNISDLLRQEKGSWVNNSRDAEVYLSNGSWGFKKQSVLPDGYWMNGDLVNFIYGDFNGDAKTDFIRQEKGKWVDGGNDVNIFISKGDGTFQNPVNMNEMTSMDGNNVNLIVGDFNGNGTDDIIRQEKGNWVNGVNDTQFYTYSNGNFVKVRDVPDMAAMNGNYTNLIAGDFDGNGITDLIRQEKGSWINNTRDAEVYLSDGSWGFKTQSVLPDGSWMNGDFVNFIPGYFNADNKTDLIRQEKGGWVDGGNDVQILISKGDGTFQNPVNMNDMGMMNGNVANLIVGDFTGQGFDDIIRQSKNSGDAQFYTFSAGNFRKVGNVPDMAAMNGSGVNLAPQIDGASSYPSATPPGKTQVPIQTQVQSGNPRIDIQLSYPKGGFSQSEINQMEKAAQNWERIITKDKDSSGVLKISVLKEVPSVSYFWAQTIQDIGVNKRVNQSQNYSGKNIDIMGVDYGNEIRFNPNTFSTVLKQGSLVRLAMHEIGHTLGLVDNYDRRNRNLMNHYSFDANMIDSIYNTMNAQGYSIDRNVTINWS